MGIGSMLELKWVFPIKSPLLTNSPSTRPYFSSVRSKEASYESASMPVLFSESPEESEALHKEPVQANSYSFGALKTMENSSVDKEEKMKVGKGLHKPLNNSVDDVFRTIEGDACTSYSRAQVNNKSRYGLLMENVRKIEDIIADTDLMRLEREILAQIGKLGALKLFNACLSRTLKEPTSVRWPIPVTKLPSSCPVDGVTNDGLKKVTVRSGRKEERKSRRKRATVKAAKISCVSPIKKISKISWLASYTTRKSTSISRSRGLVIARNESEMSRGVKDVANLERIRTNLEEESGKVVSFSIWAEAAGVDEKELQQRLHFGWSCRDRLLRSTRSLVMYLARNYRGLGIPLEDLLQAGNMGVLQGSERFDHTRGYQFSTYVQYWIRKSMLKLVAQHSKGIQIPMTVNRVINQIQRARRALYSLHGKYPDDVEISRFTGLSFAKIRSASKCPRIVGSIDKKMGYSISVKFMEFTPDTTIKTPEEVVMRHHMEKSISELLQGLNPRERQVLVLRYGLWDGQCKSLEEIGRTFKCTKEWIRKIEKSALTKVRTEEVQRNLHHYLIS